MPDRLLLGWYNIRAWRVLLPVDDEDRAIAAVEIATTLPNAAGSVEAILETAEEIGAERIVMAGHRRTPVGKVLFGSVTQSVLLHSDVPVTVIAA